MPTTTVTPGNPFRRDVPAAEPAPVAPSFIPAVGVTINTGMAALNSGLGTREQIEAELDAIAQSVRGFAFLTPDHVMRLCSAYTARLTELAVLLHRQEGYDKRLYRIRTMQVTPFLEECERQFRTASRLVEISRQDIALIGGQV